MDDLVQELQPIFRDILDQPKLVLTRESNATNVDDWDSLAHINLVTAIEKQYNIEFKLGELQQLKNVGEMTDLMRTKIAAK